MFTIKRFAAPLAALALPVLLATSALAKPAATAGKMSGSKMSGKKMASHKSMSSSMALKGLVPMHGPMLSKSVLRGARVVGHSTMNGMKCTSVRLRNGKTVMMCSAAEKMKMDHSKMSGSKMSGKM